MTTESITWIPVTERLPDDETTVLIATPGADPWPGWHDEVGWFQADGSPVEEVTHWANMPEGPG